MHVTVPHLKSVGVLINNKISYQLIVLSNHQTCKWLKVISAENYTNSKKQPKNYFY